MRLLVVIRNIQLDKFIDKSYMFKELRVYMRIYNNELIKVFTGEDLSSSEVISKLKGRDPAGFTFRDEKNNIVFHDIDKISAKELQLVIRKSKTATIAIKLNDVEVIDYFYVIARVELLEHNREECKEDKLYSWMNASIDSGILKSSVWDKAKPKVIEQLKKEGFIIIESDHNYKVDEVKMESLCFCYK